MKDYGYVYIVRCIPTGEFYVGRKRFASKTETPYSTAYLGTGLILKQRVLEYGKKSFQKKALRITKDTDESDFYEKHYIGMAIEKYGDRCINIALGGKNGGSPILRHPNRDEINRKRGNSLKGKPPVRGMLGKTHSAETRLKMAAKKIGHHPWNKGKSGYLSEEIRKQMSDRLKGKDPWNKGMVSESVMEKRRNKKEMYKGMLGKKHTDATKALVSMKNKGKIPPNRLQIARIDLDKNIIQVYPSRRHASDEGYTTAHRAANSGMTLKSRGFYFLYLKDISEEDLTAMKISCSK